MFELEQILRTEMTLLLTVRDGVVVLVCADGSCSVPSAIDAYSMISGDDERTDVVLGSALRELRANPERADVRLVLSLSQDGGGTILAAPHVRRGADWMEASTVVNTGVDHLVVDGDWIALDGGALHEISAIAMANGLTWPARLTLRQYLGILTDVQRSWVLLDRTASELTAERLVGNEVSAIPEVEAKLYPYQVVGVRWLQRVVREGIGGILADEMGLGKTLQIITLISGLRGSPLLPVLIVGPSSILENWRRELVRFAPSLRILVHRGADRTGNPAHLFAHDVVVSSYETVLRDEVLLRQRTWGLVVADEAQAIKNPDTERSRGMRRLPKRVALAVTGTPLENRLRDLWSIADFATPGVLGDVETFSQDYELSADGATRVGHLMAPLMLRRKTSAVAADLPELIDIPQFISLTASEAESYERIRGAVAGFSRPQFAMISALQKFCSHPMLDSEAEWQLEDGSKFVRLTEIIGEAMASDEKVLVFAAYRRMINLISEDLSQRFGVPAFELYGETPIEQRQNVVDRFSQTEGPAVLVLNPRAGGVGLNITAASQVVHYSAEWNPAVIDQATKRAHRLGQKRVVRVHRLLCAGTIDEVVNDRVLRKRALAEQAVLGTDGHSNDLADLVRAIALSPSPVA